MTYPSTLIFLHIAKTGGSTLRSIIERQFAKPDIYDLDPSYFVSDSKQYEAVLQERVAMLNHMPEAEKARFRCFFHPAAYGLHQILPQASQYFTFLRDPIDHFVSSYYFAVNKPGHIQHDLIQQENLRIEDFAERLPIDNLQTRRLSGADPIDQLNNLIPVLDESHLRLAKQNLAQMPVFGLTERYDESLLLIQERFTWKDVTYTAKNVAPKRLGLSELSPEFKKKLERHLAMDMDLYHFAETLFQERLLASHLDMKQAIDRFRKQNQWLGQKQRLRQRLGYYLKFRFLKTKSAL